MTIIITEQDRATARRVIQGDRARMAATRSHVYMLRGCVCEAVPLRELIELCAEAAAYGRAYGKALRGAK